MHKIIEERRGHPQGNWGCFALACYAFRRYCRSLQKRNTNINGSCLQKCKFINLHKRATVIKKRKQMKLSYNLFLFPSFLSHCCPQLTRKKGVPPLFFLTSTLCLLLIARLFCSHSPSSFQLITPGTGLRENRGKENEGR